MGEHTLILGGAKSGKTSLALRLAEAAGPRPVYLATAQARDPEMALRIARHRAERGPAWSTVEEPLELTEALAQADGPGAVILVDCLTLWLSNLLGEGLEDAAVEAKARELTASLAGLDAPVILVANEVGLGIVPENALARRFRDLAGRLHQDLAAVCGRVVLVAAGLPLTLKGQLPVI